MLLLLLPVVGLKWTWACWQTPTLSTAVTQDARRRHQRHHRRRRRHPAKDFRRTSLTHCRSPAVSTHHHHHPHRMIRIQPVRRRRNWVSRRGSSADRAPLRQGRRQGLSWYVDGGRAAPAERRVLGSAVCDAWRATRGSVRECTRSTTRSTDCGTSYRTCWPTPRRRLPRPRPPHQPRLRPLRPYHPSVVSACPRSKRWRWPRITLKRWPTSSARCAESRLSTPTLPTAPRRHLVRSRRPLTSLPPRTGAITSSATSTGWTRLQRCHSVAVLP